MRAAILAGGKGTRISREFPDIPKPMIPLLDKPLLQYQIEALVLQGFTDITLIVGYKAEVIQEHFGEGSALGANISYIVEDIPLGTGGALAMLPEDDYLIIFGDLYADISFSRFSDFHRDKNSEISLFVHPNSHPHDSDIVVTDANSRVTGWESKKGKKSPNLRNLVNSGIYILSRRIISNLKSQTEPVRLDLDRDIVRPAIGGGFVYAYRSTEYVKDMGTPERLKSVTEDVSSGTSAARNLKNRQRAIFFDRDGVLNIFKGLISKTEQLELIPNAAEAVGLVNKSEYLAICITNQPVIARGVVTLEGLDKIHGRLDELLAESGAYLDDLIYCPHHPDKGFPEEVPEYKIACDCRKPRAGMIFQAAERYNIDLSESFMIGDTTRDIAAGIAAGCKTIGVRTGEAMADGCCNVRPDFLAGNAAEAVELILY